MKLTNEMLERWIAMGMVIIGCLIKNYMIACIGVVYFIAKM